MTRQRLSRRDLLRFSAAAAASVGVTGWSKLLADELAESPARRRQCILLWMTGGPSQIDTFDLKPDHANGGPFSEIATAAPGLRFSEHLPELAKAADRLAVLRGLSTSEGDHSRATYLMRTGHRPGGAIRYPTIGAALAKETGDASRALPNFVSVAPFVSINPAAFGPGFLGPRHAPLTVSPRGGDPAAGGFAELGVDDLRRSAGIAGDQMQTRQRLWTQLEEGFLANHRTAAPVAHHTVYERAMHMLESDAARGFDLSEEPDDVRTAYGSGVFGQGCLMARRLVERGVPFVEVSFGGTGGGLGWDTHQNNFDAVRQLSGELDRGWATLMRELDERGLLETTTIVWMGEFGRTPVINNMRGRDHHPAAWSAVLAGGGVAGGQAYGRTSDDGMEVADGKLEVGDLLATVCRAQGVDPETRNISDIGRPIAIAEGTPVEDIIS